ncbi:MULTISPECIES: hypothetical protein [unclassified Streptomyces]|uniref:hypothetical protein n=1 Tax=unclassified Streptomyces TaxID=2593676 RepID=UPI000823B44E|nr:MULTISPECIES: hypothetical protein [unclassified Streptomyces]AWN30577.1 hypothetical protein DKG71_34665 [Streptomyces sp. NEAU-S7GS2]MYT15691.1 hypothetical protein [Streptomyces sp. SID4951]SCK23878.1 hypothetical protein YWIDRAFT_05164 [Streptomyces sp. SceaMP-e96]
MVAPVAINGLGRVGRSVPTEHAFDVAGIVCVTARKTTDADVNEIFRQKAARARYQDGLGAVDITLVSSGIVACPRASAVGLTRTTLADDDLPAVTAGSENERGRVQQMVRQALATRAEAASPR